MRVHLGGFEPKEDRVFYYFVFYDETSSTPQVWYFDLDGEEPTRPIRAVSLEGEDDGIRTSRMGISDAWRALSKNLIPLQPLQKFDLNFRVESHAEGMDVIDMVPAYRARVTLEIKGVRREVELRAFCEPIVSLLHVYGVPGRSEVLAIISYKGRAYGCEAVDLPILFSFKQSAPESINVQSEPAGSGVEKSCIDEHIIAERDPFEPVTWYRSARNITMGSSYENASFDIELRVGRWDDGRKVICLHTAYRATKTPNRPPRAILYTELELSADGDKTLEVYMTYPDKQIFIGEDYIEEWSSCPVLTWLPQWKPPAWLLSEDTKTIRARFMSDVLGHEFDLTPDQVAALKEMSQCYLGK